MADKTGVLVLGEVFAGIISPHTHEMFAAGTKLAEELGQPLTLAMLGTRFEDAEPYLEALDDSITVVWHEVLEGEPFFYMAWVDVAADVVRSGDYRAVISPGTGIGVDWTPRLAARCGLPLVSWSTGIAVADGKIAVTRDVLGGRAETTVSCDADTTVVIALEPGMIEPIHIGTAEALTLADVFAEFSVDSSGTTVDTSVSRPPLKEAERVVSGGRGLIDGEGVKKLEALADVLNAAIGASGAAVLQEILPHEMQVGSSGVVIRPKLYLAVGLSGSPQHTYGMKDAQYIVAINQDEGAPIFQMADFGVVGDLHQILPALVEELKS
ncbi:MAG: electron transfer flavoprotein subunit alpha/FixB family protein [Thermomicrobiales bacterium]|nr:electron transfer flavoprotein subunit alpha/FixB family protein [Thermomicrobiales bacterium]